MPNRRSCSRRPIPSRTAFLPPDVRGALLLLPKEILVLLLHVALPEAVSRMESVQDHHRHNHHRALEADEEALVPDQGAAPALAQLGDAVDGPDEDAKGRQAQRHEEDAELGAGPQRRVRRVQRGAGAQGPHPPQRLDHEVQTQQLEEEQREDLERQPGHHDVVARVGALVLVAGYGRHAAADRLEEEGDDVAGDEDAGVGEGFDVGVFGAKGHDDAGEREINPRGQECRGDGQAHDLHQEAVLLIGISHG